jgi:ariadne-1
MRLPCPTGNACENKVAMEHWKILATSDQLKKYQQLVFRDIVSKTSWISACPNCDCLVESEYKSRPCIPVECVCGIRFCFCCGDPEVHFPLTCEQFKTWKVQLEEQHASVRWEVVAAPPKPTLISRECINCKVITQRTGGCNHMTCSMCRAEW